jgi:hypothetical protein
MTVKNLKIFWVISNFKQDPTNIIDVIKHTGEYVIFDQGDGVLVPKEIINGDFYSQSKHTGHNISDYLRYIIDNYEDLPERVGFIKGNVFPRHISKEKFLARIKEPGFVPLYHEDSTLKPKYHKIFKWRLIAQHVAPGYYMEIANDWYCRAKKNQNGKFYTDLRGFLKDLLGVEKPEYISFVPGACMIVPKNKILRWPVEFYIKLYEIVSYEFFPLEAYHLERSMLYVFNYPKNN